ncbi:MAG: methionyl-tRNA formyltransferase [Flavobacterium sp.]|uniref:formyltransferase family protein n=1 Tax=Flavobacterium sp. TaxID=239 RepID=UPI0025C661E3|nr:formyltransferase family protein [Flavobacterium sp.]MBA4133333.1 methionyl-tRNA formyltransferase [Flavobacterium sp.]
MKKLKVFISGQKYFGEQVLSLCLRLDFVEVVGVCSPLDDRYVTKLAHRFNIPVVSAGTLNADTLPDNVELGITAHSFDYIGTRTRYKAKIGWIGYHPSLLPRHRGRSSIEWAVRMRDAITGGTVFWLNSGIDRGDIAYQEIVFIDPKLYAMEPIKAAKLLWEHELQAMGLKLIEMALKDISQGVLIKRPQKKEYSTFEPNTDVKDVFKPDLLMLEQFGSDSN